jgi:hypothetical protein
MSAHSSKALKCACGGYYIFSEYHWPHCHRNPDRVATAKDRLFESARKRGVVAAATVVIMLVGCALFAASAKAETVAYITQQTRVVLHKRLVFAGFPYVKINAVRCQTNGNESWFCIVHESSVQTGPLTYDFVVSVNGNNLHWAMQS